MTLLEKAVATLAIGLGGALLAWLLLTSPPEYGNIPSPYFCDILAAVCLV